MAALIGGKFLPHSIFTSGGRLRAGTTRSRRYPGEWVPGNGCRTGEWVPRLEFTRIICTAICFNHGFEGALVEKESHLLELIRYVVLNPVRARMVESPDGWAWRAIPQPPDWQHLPTCSM